MAGTQRRVRALIHRSGVCLLVSVGIVAAVQTAWPVPSATAAVAAMLGRQVDRRDVNSQLVWFDRAGTRLGTVGRLADYANLELSPDGSQVAVAVLDPATGTHDIWMYDVTRGRRTRFTSDPADENWLIWSPDGQRVVFNSFGPEGLELRGAPARNARAARVLLGDVEGKWPVSWSPDGRSLLVVKNSQKTGNDVWVLPLDGDREAFPFLQTSVAENWAAFSPDGRWVAFSSDQTGQPEVYVTGFPDGGPRWLVSTDGGIQARWRRDGGELFYLGLDGTLMTAAIDGLGPEFQVGAVESLFDIHVSRPPYHAFDVSPDGQRFLVNWLVVASGSGTLVADAR